MITKNILEKLEQKQDFDVQIGDITYRVKFDKDHTTISECFGQHSYNQQLIYLQPDIHISKLRNTFIHEVLHGMLAVSGLSHEEEVEKVEEKVTRVLAEHINMFIDVN